MKIGSDIEFGSFNRLRGLQMGAVGKIKLGSNTGAVHGVYAEAGGNFQYGSNKTFGGCPSNLTSPYGTALFPDGEYYVMFALVE